jgi:hypothetical protein
VCSRTGTCAGGAKYDETGRQLDARQQKLLAYIRCLFAPVFTESGETGSCDVFQQNRLAQARSVTVTSAHCAPLADGLLAARELERKLDDLKALLRPHTTDHTVLVQARSNPQ